MKKLKHTSIYCQILVMMTSVEHLSYPQANALNALEAIKDKKYISTFVKALDNDSPVIRQAAIS